MHIKHRLQVHADALPEGWLLVHYSYPFSQPHPLPETIVKLDRTEIPGGVLSTIETLKEWLFNEIEPESVRLPHTRDIIPSLQAGILTVVTRDQQRQLPIVRIYAYESIPGLPSQREVGARFDPTNFPPELKTDYHCLRNFCNRAAWEDYEQRLSPFFRA